MAAEGGSARVRASQGACVRRDGTIALPGARADAERDLP